MKASSVFFTSLNSRSSSLPEHLRDDQVTHRKASSPEHPIQQIHLRRRRSAREVDPDVGVHQEQLSVRMPFRSTRCFPADCLRQLGVRQRALNLSPSADLKLDSSATISIMIHWSTCDAVERDPERVSGVWVFRGSRVPVAALFENLEDGVPVGEFVQLFPGVTLAQARAVLEHAARSALAAA